MGVEVAVNVSVGVFEGVGVAVKVAVAVDVRVAVEVEVEVEVRVNVEVITGPLCVWMTSCGELALSSWLPKLIAVLLLVARAKL